MSFTGSSTQIMQPNEKTFQQLLVYTT